MLSDMAMTILYGAAGQKTAGIGISLESILHIHLTMP